MKPTSKQRAVGGVETSTNYRETERCTVPSCGGFYVHVPNGEGKVISYCEACAYRVEQVKLLRSAFRSPSR